MWHILQISSAANKMINNVLHLYPYLFFYKEWSSLIRKQQNKWNVSYKLDSLRLQSHTFNLWLFVVYK